MKLIIASNNAHKAREIREILGPLFPDMQTMAEAGVSLEVVEDGASFAENAVKKAEAVLAAAPGFDAALGDDSGLMVDCLGGAPGIYSARYAGECHNDAQNNARLMADTLGVPEEKRGCRFASAVALARRDASTLAVTGYCEGTLLTAPRGENGFGYDPYFYYKPFGKSFAELTAEEKNRVSHRRNALEALRARLAETVSQAKEPGA